MKRVFLLAGALALATAAVLSSGFAASLGVGSQKLTPGARTIVRASCPTLGAAADAFVSEQNTSQTNNTTTLEVRSDAPRRRYTLIRFDLASCGLPAGANVESATLRLVVTTAPASARTYNVHRVTASWSETTVTWANQPAVAATATASVAIPTTTGAIAIDVTSDVDQFATGGATNHGWRISDAVTATSATAQFASSTFATTASRPQLLVSYGY